MRHPRSFACTGFLSRRAWPKPKCRSTLLTRLNKQINTCRNFNNKAQEFRLELVSNGASHNCL